jgi:starch-binding outer membrane protein, SusD/RagB family
MNIFSKIIIAVSLTMLGIGCEKKLTDLEPINQIPGEKAIATLNDLGTAVQGIYGGWQQRRSVYISSFLTDEIRLGTGSEYRNVGNALFNWQFVSDSQDWRDAETGGVWTNLYQVIDRANRVLELMVPVPATSTVDSALKSQYRGEALAARAFAHLELLRTFSATAEYNGGALGIVLQKEYVKNPATYKPSRATQAEAMSLIEADLAEAKTRIPTSFFDIGRLTRNAVIGGQVRAALHKKDWRSAIDRANEVVPLQPLASIATYPALWTVRTLASSQATEVIWKQNVSAANLGFAIGSLYQDLNGAQQAAPSAKLMSSYDQVNDVRFSTFFKTVPRNLIAKYGFIPFTSENFQYDIKMMRTSELVLARAEAYAELNKIDSANIDLAALRSRRINLYTHTNIPAKNDVIDAILLERYKELCYEGNRYFDLRRRSLPIARDISDIGGLPTSQTLNPTEFRYILPIPNQEIQANPNCVQNPGY